MAPTTFRLACLPNPPAPLPLVPGPKLAPFTPSAQADIEFVEFLGRENDKDSQVWKVNINGTGPFALKMFYFFQWGFLKTNYSGDLSMPLANEQLYIDYFDPFSCECRAYARLKEANHEDVAVKTHGYLLLTPQQEAEVAQRVTGEAYNPRSGNNFWAREEQHRKLPVRAIVKALAGETHHDPAHSRDMWTDLQVIHSLGILVQDTHGGNYMDGKLVDFSRAWTMCHPSMDPSRAGALRRLLLSELQRLVDYYYELANSSSKWLPAIPQDLEDLCVCGDLERYENVPWADDCGEKDSQKFLPPS